MKETVIPKMREETQRVKMVFELKKDLAEDMIVCNHCHGAGLEIEDNVYGIKGDTTHIGVHFPYKHQTLSFCRYCAFGVQEICPACGSRKLRNKACPCGAADKEREERYKKESAERWEKASKIRVKSLVSPYECFYIENIDRYIFDIDELDDLIEDYELEKSELRIYVTKKTVISIDATDVAESACDGLHEDAYDECDTESLQKLLDDWCKEQTGTTTYSPNYSIGVIMFD